MRSTNSKLTLTTLFAVIIFSLFVTDAFTVIENQDSKNKAAEQPTKQQLRSGYNFIQTKAYTQEEDLEILKLFKGLRVSDVSDGMDKAGRRDFYKKLDLKPDDSVK